MTEEESHIKPYKVQAEIEFQVPARNAAKAVQQIKEWEEKTKKSIGGWTADIKKLEKV